MNENAVLGPLAQPGDWGWGMGGEALREALRECGR